MPIHKFPKGRDDYNNYGPNRAPSDLAGLSPDHLRSILKGIFTAYPLLKEDFGPDSPGGDSPEPAWSGLAPRRDPMSDPL